MVVPRSPEVAASCELDYDSQLENSALIRLEKLPHTSAFLERLQRAHEPTYRHSLRVGEIMARTVETFLPSGALESAHSRDVVARLISTVFVCGVMHDIGKQVGAIPELLDKKGMLSEAEIGIVGQHVPIGVSLMEVKREDVPQNSAEYDYFAEATVAIKYHHTPYDALQDSPDYLITPWIPLLTQLADQIDARTDCSRAYLRAEDSRENPGVVFTDTTQIISPELLLAAVLRDSHIPPHEMIFGLPFDQVVQTVYESRFGTGGQVERMLPVAA